MKVTTKLLATCVVLALLAIGTVAQAESLLSATFNSDRPVVTPAGWNVEGDETWTWKVCSVPGHPSMAQHDGNSVQFDSYDITTGRTSRLVYATPLNFTGYSSLELSYYMTHDKGFASNDRVQWQYNAGSSWVDIGSAISRYENVTDPYWKKETVIFSSLAGQSSVQIGLLGTSGYGNNIYIDSISLTGTGSAVPEPATLLGFGLPMLMVGIGKLRGLRK